MNNISITTSQNIELEYELASVGDRVVGRIIDLLIIGAYAILVILLFSFSSNSGSGPNFLLIFVLLLPVIFYDLILEMWLNGQSVGKRVMSIKVISLTGEQPSFGQYLLRWLFRIIDFSLLSGLVALITVAVSEKKQRLGDMVAGTVLVKTKPRTVFQDTFYVPTEQPAYTVTYPEVSNLSDSDIQLVKEVLTTVYRSGNPFLALQAQEKIEEVLNIKSRSSEPKVFLQTVLADYNYLTSQE